MVTPLACGMALAVIGTAAEPRAANIAVAAKPALKNFDMSLSCHRASWGDNAPAKLKAPPASPLYSVHLC
ncbi:hypothetical protein D3C86_1789390 [compost metagenome]